MKALADLFSTDYGIMSLIVVTVTIGITVGYGIWFVKKAYEEPSNSSK